MVLVFSGKIFCMSIKFNAIPQSSTNGWPLFPKTTSSLVFWVQLPLRGCVAEKASGTKAEYDQVGGFSVQLGQLRYKNGAKKLHKRYMLR